MKKGIVLTSFILMFIGVSHAQTRHIPLNTGWTFVCDSMEKPLPAAVPGNCYLDLMDHAIIPDVYFADNGEKYQWPGKTAFTYTLNFDYNEETDSHADLIFYGLDTYADIYLNDSLIKKTDNMFITWEIPVEELLQEHNTLKIIFHPVVETALPIKEAYPYDLPADSDQGEEKTSIFTRKAGYQYGWDFAPRFTGCGIWKPVELRVWKDARIKDVYYHTKSLGEEFAVLDALVYVEIAQEGDYYLKSTGLGNNGAVLEHVINPEPGGHYVKFDFQIDSPELWWPNGMGKAHLYSAKLELFRDAILIDTDEQKVGIRTIELVQNEDKIGESFYFVVNGEKIFAQGANWVPPDMFPGRIDSTQYENLIGMARNAHFNMLRVWGGGVYPDDYFFELCDENGILVWQDFMFACSFYPLNPPKVLSIAEEARDNILRIRNHASLALWCGNNEIDEAWHNWGYQAKYGWSETDSAEIWKQYTDLFHFLLPEAVSYTDPSTDYISSSPKYGWGRLQSMTHGDSHYWGVWWGMQPFDIYREKTGRFMSEYGFQALPDETTLLKMAGKVDSVMDPQWRAHQKHPTGFETINTYMEREFSIPEEPYDYAYLSQIIQARGLSIAFISHRMSDFCDGTLFWQFNEPWPGINWSAIDYYGKPKALYYEAKRCFAPQYIFAEEKYDSVSLVLLNTDVLKNIELQITLFSTDGKELFSEKIFYKYFEGNRILAKYPSEKFKVLGSKEDLILYFKISQNGVLLSDNFYTFVPLRELNLQDPEFSFESCASEQFIVRVKKPALYVHPQSEIIQDNDYFILMPGFSRKVRSEFLLKLISLYDVLN